METTITAISSTNDTAFPSHWVFGMLLTGFIGIILITFMFAHSMLHFFKMNEVQKVLRILYAIFFVSYLSTCVGYALFRTDLLLPMGSSISCAFGYYFTTQSVYFAKLMLWTVFMYRIDLAFHSSAMGYPRSLLIGIITTLVTIATALDIMLIFVTKDIVTFEQSEYLNGAITGLCTSGSGDDKYGGLFSLTMGLLFLFDMIANIVLCTLFTYKLRIVIQMGADCSGPDRKLQKVMRKQTILVLIACITTMMVYGVGAMVSGFSLIMPLDATINASCIWLMFSFSDAIWNKITHFCCWCCYCDCCGHKDDFMMTLHSIRGFKASALRTESMTGSKSGSGKGPQRPQRFIDIPAPISECTADKNKDIEIKFDNNITPFDLPNKKPTEFMEQVPVNQPTVS